MTKFRISIVIKRPVEDVFSFLADPTNFAKWESGVVESSKTSEGPIGVGTSMKEVGRILGREINTTAEITEYEQNSRFSIKSTSGSILMKGTYIFEAMKDGTKVTLMGEYQLAGFLKLASPVVKYMAKRNIQADHNNLKKLLEAQPKRSAQIESPDE